MTKCRKCGEQFCIGYNCKYPGWRVYCPSCVFNHMKYMERRIRELEEENFKLTRRKKNESK